MTRERGTSIKEAAAQLLLQRSKGVAEIAALCASGATAITLKLAPGNALARGLGNALARAGFAVDPWGVGILVIVAVTTVAWVAATFLTKADDEAKLLAFYRKVRPGGAWGPIARLDGRRYKLKAAPFVGWALAVVMIVCLLFGLGKIIFMDWGRGAAYLAVGGLAAFGLSKIIARIDWEGQ